MRKSILCHIVLILCLLAVAAVGEPFGFSANKKNWETVSEPCPLPQETILYRDGQPVFDIITTNTPGGKAAKKAPRVGSFFVLTVNYTIKCNSLAKKKGSSYESLVE